MKKKTDLRQIHTHTYTHQFRVGRIGESRVKGQRRKRERGERERGERGKKYKRKGGGGRRRSERLEGSRKGVGDR